jgi:uncharacterized protein
MLESSFIFLKGIGESTERFFWEHGLLSWDHFISSRNVGSLSTDRKNYYDHEIEQAKTQLGIGCSRYFAQILKARDHWRLYETFRHNTAYLDIETTGAPLPLGDITVVGIYGRGKMTTLIQGSTLTARTLSEELESYDLLVSFFGSGFDLPFLRAKFPNLLLSQPHFDVCFAARRLGLKGGLKAIEIELGCDRSADVSGLTGWDAVRLWEAWQQGHEAAGNLLIRYNQADTQNLQFVADTVYLRMVQKYGPAQFVPRIS